MPVRVKLEIKFRQNNVTITTLALVSTGFTSETSDLAVPVSIAEKFGLWPRPSGAISVSLEIGGCEVESYIVPQAAVVKVVTQDRVSKEVTVNIVVNPFVNEILISDALAEELGVQILYPRRGLLPLRFSLTLHKVPVYS